MSAGEAGKRWDRNTVPSELHARMRRKANNKNLPREGRLRLAAPRFRRPGTWARRESSRPKLEINQGHYLVTLLAERVTRPRHVAGAVHNGPPRWGGQGDRPRDRT